MKTFTVGSLFTGIGGIDLGLERTGRFTSLWQVEIKEYATKVLEQQWPHVTRFRDVRDCGKQNLVPVDIITLGFPCQDISQTGKRAGMQEGTRSGLWSHAVRIICELRPSYVLVENVSALRSPLKRGRKREAAPLSRVLGDLAAIGYDAEWEMLPAAAFGAPHIRWRFFIVAYPNSNRLQTIFPQSSLLPETNDHEIPSYPNSISTWRANPERLLWSHEPTVGRVADGFPYRVDQLEGLGNAVVPVVAQFVGDCIAFYEDSVNLKNAVSPYSLL